MDTEKVAESNPVQEEPQQEAPQKQQDASPDFSQLKNLLRETINEVFNEKKISDEAAQAQDYNKKIAKAVNNAQSNLIKPNIDAGQNRVDYVKRVIEEDSRRRLQDSEGKNRYSESDPKEFTKAKIIILKKIGLTEEEIAREMADYL